MTIQHSFHASPVIFIVVACLAFTSNAFGQTLTEKINQPLAEYPKTKQEKVIRGLFEVAKNSLDSAGHSKLVLRPIESNLKNKTLVVIESNQNLKMVRRGTIIKVVGKILRISTQAVDLSQAHLFLKSKTGLTPLLVLSRYSDHLDLSNMPYLQMHAPVGDFTVF